MSGVKNLNTNLLNEKQTYCIMRWPRCSTLLFQTKYFKALFSLILLFRFKKLKGNNMLPSDER